MRGYDILNHLSFKSAQETSRMCDFAAEVQERLKDIDLIDGYYPSCLLIGTTPPEMVAWLLKFGRRPMGIALDHTVIQHCAINFNMEVLEQDMHDIEFPDEWFDFVYASQVLEHSPAPMVVLTQIYRVLKRGGQAFFWMPDDVDNRKVEYHYSCFPREIWEDLITKVGFEINSLNRRHNSWGYAVSKVVKDSNMIKLNLGCGAELLDGWVNIDKSEDVKCDLRLDVVDGLPYKDGEVGEIHSGCMLEQLTPDEFILVINDCHRVLEVGGKLNGYVPSTDSRVLHLDPMDKMFFQPDSFRYLVRGEGHYERFGKCYGFLPWSSHKVDLRDNGIIHFELIK